MRKPAKNQSRRKPEPAIEIPPEPKQEVECCGNCHFWRDARCKRYPPNSRPGQNLAGDHNVIAVTEWCGEHRRAA